MDSINYRVLENIKITVLGSKIRDLSLKKDGTFIYDPRKKYKPEIDVLVREGKLKKIIEEKQSNQFESEEQISSNENRQHKSQWKFPKLLKGNVSNESIDSQKYNVEEDSIDTMESQAKYLEAHIRELHKSNTEIKELNQDIKSNLGSLKVNDVSEIKTNIDSLIQTIERYPKPVSLNHLNSLLEPVFKDISHQSSSIENKLHSLPNQIKSEIDRSVSKISYTVNQNSESISHLSNSLRTSISQIDTKVKEIPEKIVNSVNDQIDETISRATRSLKKSVDQTKEAVESLEGKANVLDDLKGKLDKVNISAKLNPFDQEDDVVIELYEQGQLVLEQLTLASRHYVAQRKGIQQLEKENAKLKQEQEQIEDITTKAVEQRVKSEVTKEMITKIAMAFANLDDVYSEEKLAGVQALLNNHGLERSDRFKVGKQITITDENRKELEVNIDFKFTGEGQYTIVQSQFVLKDNKKSFKKAKAEKGIDFQFTNDIVGLPDEEAKKEMEEKTVTIEEPTTLEVEEITVTTAGQETEEPEKIVVGAVEEDTQESEENALAETEEEIQEVKENAVTEAEEETQEKIVVATAGQESQESGENSVKIKE